MIFLVIATMKLNSNLSIYLVHQDIFLVHQSEISAKQQA